MIVRELVTKFGFKTDSTKLRTYNRQVEKAKNRTGAFDRRVKRTRTSLQKFGLGLSVINRKFQAFSLGLEKRFAGVLKPLRAMGGQIPLIGGALQSMSAGGILATGAIVGLGAAVIGTIAALRKATAMYARFEMGLKGVERITLATAEEMLMLKKAALEAGEASVFSTADAAEAEKFLAQAGLSVKDVIGALPGTLQLAAAGNLDLASAADIATNVLTSNKLAVEELSRVNDVLAKSAASSNTDVLQLGSAFSTVGNTGALAGVQIEEMAGLLGILANNGNRGTLAGTLLRNVFVRLMAVTPKAQKAMDKLGIDINGLTDESGKFVKGGLVKFFGELNQAMAEGKINAGEIISVFGERAGRAISTFAATSTPVLTEMIGKIEASGGTAEKAAKIAFKGMTGAAKLFGSRMEAASNQAFEQSGLRDVFEQIVRILADILPPLIRGLGVILAPIGKTIAFILTLLRPVFAIIGGILNLFFKMTSKALSPLIDELDIGIQVVSEFADILFSAFDKAFRAAMKFFDMVFRGLRPILDLATQLNNTFGIMGDDTLKKFGTSLWNNVLKPLFPFVRLLDRLMNGTTGQADSPAPTGGGRASVGGESEVQRILRQSEQPGQITNKNASFKGGQINVDVNVNGGGAGGASEIGDAVGSAVKQQFNIELRRVLTEASF